MMQVHKCPRMPNPSLFQYQRTRLHILKKHMAAISIAYNNALPRKPGESTLRSIAPRSPTLRLKGEKSHVRHPYPSNRKTEERARLVAEIVWCTNTFPDELFHKKPSVNYQSVLKSHAVITKYILTGSNWNTQSLLSCYTHV